MAVGGMNMQLVQKFQTAHFLLALPKFLDQIMFGL
jgi:hypothetical protein